MVKYRQLFARMNTYSRLFSQKYDFLCHYEDRQIHRKKEREKNLARESLKDRRH